MALAVEVRGANELYSLQEAMAGLSKQFSEIVEICAFSSTSVSKTVEKPFQFLHPAKTETTFGNWNGFWAPNVPLSSPLCSSDLVALLTVPYNHSAYSLLLLEQTIGNTGKNFWVHGVWTSRLSTELFEPVLTSLIQVYLQVIALKCQPDAINTYDILIPTMGPKLRDTRARPLYENTIFCLIQEDDDGNVNDSIEGPVTWGRGRGRGRGQGGKGKAATSIDPGLEPPTSTLED
ncbi:hypothetical protein JB92DRAFT_3110520 [Gautieria morchelliformis]|nr:hypothetical protein JB92DRAFT_3110520 [Gautieria morchelliformis]